MKGKIFKNLAVLFLTIFLFFILFEIFLKVALPQPLNYMEFNETTEYFPRKNFNTIIQSEEFTNKIKTNSLGFRDDEFSMQKEENAFRIIVLGDSLSFGWGVGAEETFPKLLENNLKEECPNVEVLNLGVPGFSTIQEVELLKNFGLSLDPDYIILTFFEGNDFSDNDLDSLWDEDGTTYKVKKLPPRNLNFKFRSFLSSHLHSYIITKKVLDAVLGKNQQRRETVQSLKIPKYYANFTSTEAHYKTMSALEEFKNTAKGIAHSILVLPPHEKVSDLAWNKFIMETNLTEAERFSTNRFFNSEDTITLYDQFLNRDELYWQIDNHFTKEGHEKTAEILRKQIKCN